MWREPDDAAAAPRAALLVFRVGGQPYALPVERVREIVRVPSIFRVPGAAPHVRGLCNLRGRILPVLDPAARLGHVPGAPGERARLVVAELGEEAVALLVDEVAELLRAPAAGVVAPAEGTAVRSVRGTLEAGGVTILVLDLDILVQPGGPR